MQKPLKIQQPPPKVSKEQPLFDAYGRPIERLPFRPGVSTVTVENLAKQVGCVGGQGAGLVTEPGPVEVYRMICDNRTVFMARCDLRQCQPIAQAAPPRPAPAPMAAPMPAPMAAPAVVTQPVSSPVSVAAAPAAKPAMVPAAMPRPTGMLGAKELPKLDIGWNCGDCVIDEPTLHLIETVYARQAAARGYTVSSTESVVMKINRFYIRPADMKVRNDNEVLKTQIWVNGKVVTINETSHKFSTRMDYLVDAVVKRVLDTMTAPVK
ncbi:MAG: hypothetical protein ACJ8GW_19015 [Massilia sp.]